MIVVYSEQDLAGSNIARHLKDAGIVETFKVDSGLLFCEKELEGLGADYIIFASKHKSTSAKACFTAHTPGNWGKAEAGGRDRGLCKAVPSAMKTILMNINGHVKVDELKSKGWSVDMECTHHGPFTEIPCFFVEIGSSETEWKNDLAGKIAADAIIDHSFKPYKWNAAFGIGGGHYCPAFTPLELSIEGGMAFAHVLPEYHMEAVDFETFKQGIERSAEKVEKILIDWKGLKGENRKKAQEFSEKSGIKWEKV